MKNVKTTKPNILYFEKCYELDFIYHIKNFINKNEIENNSKYWIAYFHDEKELQYFEIFCDSKLIHSYHSSNYNYDDDSSQIIDDSLDWISDNIGEFLDYECVCISFDEFFSSLGVKVKFGLEKPLILDKQTVDEINTNLYSFFQLKYKKYGNLINFIDGLTEVISDLEEIVDALEKLQLKGELTPELEKTMNLHITQLDYLYKNLNTGLEVKKYHDDKTKFKHNEIILNLN
jgi:hypothetical protein